MSQNPTVSKRKRDPLGELTDVESNKKRTPSVPTKPSKVEPVAPDSTTPILIRDEVEFDREDLDGRIKRCEERIANGYATEAFKKKLEGLKTEKKRRS